VAEQHAGNAAQAQALYRQVKEEGEHGLATQPDNRYVETGWHAALGLALAGLGEREAAGRAAAQVMELVPESADRLEGAGLDLLTARASTRLSGDAAKALPLLRHLIETRDRASVFDVGQPARRAVLGRHPR
jgi:hypothetical protein